MDTTALQAKIDSLNQTIDTDNQTLQTDEAALKTAQEDWNFATTINTLEALTADQVSEINTALASDPDNKSGISISLPPATETAQS